MASIILFGGSGFVGTHLQHILGDRYERIVLADIRPPMWHTKNVAPLNPRTVYTPCDVRRTIPAERFPGRISAIVNLAAVHTSPGHPPHEYFEANIRGAETVTAFAERKKIERIVFTSSISVYGPGEEEKSEEDIPMPAIPYGSSKIVAEFIHREWFKRNRRRKLSIMRPAVIFGAGEGGNFTRIANALENGIFAYPGRKDTIKGCLYVKDLCRYIIDRLEHESAYSLYNFCYPEKMTIEHIVNTIKQTFGYTAPDMVLPLWSINAGAALMRAIPLSVIENMRLHPERIVKLVRSTNISARRLVDAGFQFEYPLRKALLDWAHDCGGTSLY